MNLYTFKALKMNSGQIVFLPSFMHNRLASEDNCLIQPLKKNRIEQKRQLFLKIEQFEISKINSENSCVDFKFGPNNSLMKELRVAFGNEASSSMCLRGTIFEQLKTSKFGNYLNLEIKAFRRARIIIEPMARINSD